MVFEFKFPDVGEGITEGTLVKWLVNVKDNIKEDDPIAQVQTDKAVVDIPSPVAGIVEELLFKDDDVIKVGQVIMKINSNSDNVSKESKEKTPTNEKEENEKEPEKQKDEPIENPKKTSFEGVLALPKVRKLARDKGIDLSTITGSGKHGEVVESDLQNNENTSKITDTSSSEESESVTSKRILATPSTRKLARDKGIDITKIEGSGKNGMVLKEDLEKPIKETKETHKEDNTKKETVELGKVIPLTSTRKIIAQRMSDSIHTNAQVTVMDEVNLTKIYDLKESLEKISYLPFIVKATVLSLKKHPYLNSKLVEEGILLESDYNIGIAVDTNYGLIVPVIKDSEKLNALEINSQIKQLATKARDQKLSPEEIRGGTFTISSIGSIGIMGFTPIINSPETAILGIGRVDEKPIIKNNEITTGKIAVFSLSFDHRVVDGAEAARFMNTLKEYLEEPSKMVLELK